MRKKISCFMLALILIRLFCLSAVAANPNDVSGWTPSVGAPSLENEVPFYVEQKDLMHRYAVDVEYESMSIQVNSAIWDVNNYVYQVEMGHIPQGTPEAEYAQYPFTFHVSIINHSDVAINSQILTEVSDTLNVTQEARISLDGGKTFANEALTGIVSVPSALLRDTFGETDDTKNTVRAVTKVSLTPKDSWANYINHLIATEVIPDDYVCKIGTLTILVSKAPSET